jgi:hypothetical protein
VAKMKETYRTLCREITNCNSLSPLLPTPNYHSRLWALGLRLSRKIIVDNEPRLV